MKNLLTEFLGTFFLVLTIGLSVIGGSPMAPFTIGAALMVMVYMGGHVSGAHYNPAVSLALAMRGAMEWSQLVPYWIAQILGSLVAAFTVRFILGETFAPAPAPTASVGAALLVEILFTFALALVVLNVATAKKVQSNSFYGLAIGFTVMVGAFAGGPVSGGAFNPAVGIGPTIVHAMSGIGGYGSLWLYLVGPFLGAAIAAAAFKVQETD